MPDDRDLEARFELGENRYGKARVRLVTVRRGPERHHLRDLTVEIALEGDFGAAHTRGDNRNVIATDTMKNTVYAFARDRLTGSPEAFGLELARHFADHAAVSRATIELVEHQWRRVRVGDREAPDAFLRLGQHSRLATITADRAGTADFVVFMTVRSSIPATTSAGTVSSKFSTHLFSV
jgi:urate oxidase